MSDFLTTPLTTSDDPDEQKTRARVAKGVRHG